LNSQALRVLLSLLVQTGTKQAAQKAIIVAEDVLRRQPTDYAAKRLLAEALICVGQEEEAFKLLMQLSTARTNEDPNLQILMAKYYYSLGCYEEAMQACQALPEGPSPLSAEVLCARAMMKTEDTQHQQDGLQLLEELNKEFAHNSAVKVRLAEARFAAGRFQTVLPLLDSAEGHLDEMSVEYVDALSLRAKTLLQMERPDEAARYVRRAERLHQQTSFAIAEISI
jgi:tetratricopeptide (TPR) repeat protein